MSSIIRRRRGFIEGSFRGKIWLSHQYFALGGSLRKSSMPLESSGPVGMRRRMDEYQWAKVKQRYRFGQRRAEKNSRPQTGTSCRAAVLSKGRYVNFDGLCLAKRYFTADACRWLWISCAPEPYCSYRALPPPRGTRAGLETQPTVWGPRQHTGLQNSDF